MVDLSVIILNWNTRDDLERCLESLEPCVLGAGVAGRETAGEGRSGPGTLVAEGAVPPQVIVVDNASTDGSVQRVRERFPWAQLIASETNHGYSGGNNIGIEAAEGRHLLLLNPDTIVHGDAMAALTRFADAHPEAGIVGAKCLNRDGSIQYSCRRFPDLMTGLTRDLNPGRLFGRKKDEKNRHNRDYLMSDWDHNSVREVDWVTGAALLIRRECMEEIGTLDDGYFMYCEDVDLCYRAHERGWKVLYCPDAVITHLGGQASDKAVTRMIVEHHRSMYRFFRKHYAKSTSPLMWPVVIGGLVARAGGLVLKNRTDVFRHARAVRREQRKR